MRDFVSTDVSWAPARLHRGYSFQAGWVVVRPGWVAFLPTARAKHIIAEMAWAFAPAAPMSRCKVGYELFEAKERGPAVFDATIVEWASHGGCVLTARDGELVRSAKQTMFRIDEKTFIMCKVQFPEPLLAGWRAGKVRFDARELAKVFAVLTAFPFALGALGGIIAYVEGESTASIAAGVGFWWALVVFSWVGYLVAWRRMRRHGPAHLRSERDSGRVHRSHPSDRGRRAA